MTIENKSEDEEITLIPMQIYRKTQLLKFILNSCRSDLQKKSTCTHLKSFHLQLAHYIAYSLYYTYIKWYMYDF